MAKKQTRTIETIAPAAAPEPEIVRANVHRKVVQSPSFVSLYSNDTQIQVTPWDVRFIFGEIDSINEQSPEITIKSTGEVRMSPQHAKRVAILLIQQLKGYEEKIGPIPLPKD